MSLFIDKTELSPKEEARLLKESKVRELQTHYKPFPKTFKLYLDLEDKYVFPRHIGIAGKTWQEYHKTPKNKISFECDKKPFTGNEGDNPDLKGEDRDQESTIQEGIKKLKETGAAFYHFSTGYGKTQCGIETIRRLGRVTLWVVFNKEVQQQTYDTVVRDTNARVYWYNTTKEPPANAQIVIIGLVKACKLEPTFLSRFQTVVLDEVDQTAATSFFPLFLKIFPTYLLGLSATIKKSNGLEKALYKYFGPQDEFIYRFIEKPLAKVIKLQTDFVPHIETVVNAKGEMEIDKHEINRSLAENKDRNKMILKLIEEQSVKGQVLVLSPRKENIIWLSEKLTKHGFDNDYKTVNKKSIDKTKPILLGGLMGCGRGFDCSAKVLIILGVPPNLTQFIGRLREPEGTVYMIVDRFDKFESDWTKKSMPYLRKLGCQIFFQVGDEVRPYVTVSKASMLEDF